MYIYHNIIMDLTSPRKAVVNVVQDDNVRFLRLTLLANGQAYDVSGDLQSGEYLHGYVEFHKADGHGGIYDETQLGVTAVVKVSGIAASNVWLVALDGQCCTCPGLVQVNVRFATSSGRVLHSFAIQLKVEQAASSDTRSIDWNHSGSFALVSSVPTQASINNGVISYRNERNEVLFTVVLPSPDSTLSTSGVAADAKAVGDVLATGVMLRSTLTAGTDMDTIVQPGVYYKSNDTALINAPENSDEPRARIIVFSGGSSISVVQIWAETRYNKIYYRTKNIATSNWASWAKVAASSEIEAALENAIIVRSAITTETDMDVITQPGMYYKNQNVAPINAPADSTANRARIVVFAAGSDNFVVQEWVDVSNNKIWHRVKSAVGVAWSDWEQLVGMTDFATAVVARSGIADNTDMDTIIQPGMYHKAASVPVLNAPPNSASRARIVVFSGGSSIAVVQVWAVTATARIWYRAKSAINSEWTTWERLIGKNELDSSIETALSTTFTLRSTIEANTDMDTITQPGMYYKPGNTALINAPNEGTTRARIVVFGGGSETSVVQLWFDTYRNRIWHRMKSAASDAWSAWERDSDTDSGGTDRYPGPVFSRAADVYAALDVLEAESGGRITHTALTDSLDSTDLPDGETADDNKMRLYKVDLTPAHMLPSNYAISNTPMYPKPKALITACIHGDERASATYVVDFIKRLLTDRDLISVSSSVEWYIIPVVNVWGFNHNNRKNSPTQDNPGGYDINRDFSDHEYIYGSNPGRTYGFKTAEARAIKQLYLDNIFVFYLDVHQADFSSNTPRCGFCSCINEQANRRADYTKLWRAIDTAGYTAQIWMMESPETIKTTSQITYNWGEMDVPHLGDASTACATAYIRGNTYWNTYSGTQHPVFATSTVETSQRCTLISGASFDFNRIALTFGAVYVQALIKELISTVLNNFDVYD